VSVSRLAVDSELAPQGSEDYYIARLHPPAERRAIALHLALEDRLLGVLRDARSPEAARLKLLWWRDSFAAAAADEFRHPLIHALAAERAGATSSWPAAFQGAAEALLERLDWQVPQPARVWLDNLSRCEGSIAAALVAGRPHAPVASTVARVNALAAGTQWARGLQWLPRWQQLGLHWLPLEDLRQHALDDNPPAGEAADAAPGHRTGHWPRLAAGFVNRGLALAIEARSALDGPARRAALAARIRLALGCAELRACADSDWPVLQERVALTPLTRLLTALAVSWIDYRPRGPDAPDKRVH
jgi:phytoene/squalene synthetase